MTAARPIPQPLPTYDLSNESFTRRIIEQRLAKLEQPAAVGYTVAHPTVNRAIDPTTATTTTTAQILATLIADLKTRGIIA